MQQRNGKLLCWRCWRYSETQTVGGLLETAAKNGRYGAQNKACGSGGNASVVRGESLMVYMVINKCCSLLRTYNNMYLCSVCFLSWWVLQNCQKRSFKTLKSYTSLLWQTIAYGGWYYRTEICIADCSYLLYTAFIVEKLELWGQNPLSFNNHCFRCSQNICYWQPWVARFYSEYKRDAGGGRCCG